MKAMDRYIKKPLLWDLIIIAIIIFIKHFVSNIYPIITMPKNEVITSIYSDLIGTTISLAGFVLASLTIIITFKDNINHKEILRKAENKEEITGIELIFSSKHYGRIVGVFSWACVIFLILFLFVIVLKLSQTFLNENIQLDLCVSIITLIFLTIVRTLIVLYSIIQIQNKETI